MTDMIAICNQKGGVAKSTTTANLAAALALKGSKALAVDFDPQMTLTATLTDTREPWEIVHIEGGYDLLTGDESWATEPFDTLHVLADELRPLASSYDYVLVDCPPTLSKATMNAIAAADRAIVPTMPSYAAAIGIPEIFKTIATVNKGARRAFHGAKVLVTMYERSGAAAEMVQQVEDAWPHYATRIRKNVAVSYSQARGLDVLAYDRKSHAALDYLALAEEVLAE